MLAIQAFTAPDQHGGKGLFADQAVFKGDTVRRYNSALTRIYSLREYQNALSEGGVHAASLKNHSYPAEAFINGDKVRVLLRDNDIGTYMNHSDEPNVGAHASRAGVMVALRNIRPGEELTCDYRRFVSNLSDWNDIDHCGSFLMAAPVRKAA